MPVWAVSLESEMSLVQLNAKMIRAEECGGPHASLMHTARAAAESAHTKKEREKREDGGAEERRDCDGTDIRGLPD